MTDSKNPPAALADEQLVPMLDAAALGDPLNLAAELLRQFTESLMSIEACNGCIFGSEAAAGPLDEAIDAIERGDYSTARGWLHIAIGKALEPVPPITTGRNAKDRHYRAVYQRERALVMARCALHLILPSLQGEVLAERLVDHMAPRH